MKEKNVKRKESKATRLKKFKEQEILGFIKKYDKLDDFKVEINGKMKLTSSDNFANSVTELSERFKGADYPVIIGQVSGFYETATLTGLMANNCKNRTKPFLLFFDKNSNNIQNAIYNTLLMASCESKEEFLTTSLQLSNIDIVKAFNYKEYEKIYNKTVSENEELEEEYIDDAFLEKCITKEDVQKALSKFSLPKLQKYVSEKEYDSEAHLKQLLKKAKENLNKEMYTVFEKIAGNICEHLDSDDTYAKHVDYLFKDIKRNKDVHILNNAEVYDGYKKLILKNGKGNIKFLPNIDISKEEGLQQLEEVLKREKIISPALDKNQFPIDIAVIPHARRFKDAYPLLKNNAQYFIEANRDHRKKDDSGVYSFQRTSTLFDPNFGNTEKNFEEELNNSKDNNLLPIEVLDGYNFTTLAGINIGYKYTSYPDLQRIVDMAKADKVDMIFLQSLIYSEHKRNQTKRRNITDNRYPDLDSRLRAGKKFIEDLIASDIPVFYQMGDEDENLREELFYTYFHEELKKSNNFLAREDTDEMHDWIKNIIYEDLIPYLIRAGQDITVYYDEKGNKRTRIGDICSYISAIKYGTPLGDLTNLVDEYGNSLIEEQYFKDTEMFKIVNEAAVEFDKDNSRVSVDMIANPNFSSETQYAKPDAGVLKRIKDTQCGAIKNHLNSQIILDSRQAYMGANIIGGREAQMALNTPQLSNDLSYLDKEILAGRKRVKSDPAHKRVTQPQNRMNFPGSWHISGDLDGILRLTPYWSRPKINMDYVQKTGEPMPYKVEMHVNDIQTGSITERIAMFLKYLDIGFYKYGASILTYLGDIQQGWNYDGFAVESRHTGAQSVGQQTVDVLKLQRPWVVKNFGVIPPKLFETNEDGINIDEEMSNNITEYLYEKDLINKNVTDFSYVYIVKDDVNYKEIELPERFKPFEDHIKRRLNTIKYLELILIADGNHEKNTDKLQKGYKPLEALKTQLEEFRNFSSMDVDIKYAEFIINSEGDLVEGSYCYSEINGYNKLSAHNFKAPSKGSSGSACRNMANWLESIGSEYRTIDIIEQGHLHNFEAAVLNDKLYVVIPGMAGQSGFEQRLGYCSHPRGLFKIYWPNGRISLDLISSNFIDNWKIQNPEIIKIGLEQHIKNCERQEAVIIASEEPQQYHAPDQRIIVPAALTKKIGTVIPR